MMLCCLQQTAAPLPLLLLIVHLPLRSSRPHFFVFRGPAMV